MQTGEASLGGKDTEGKKKRKTKINTEQSRWKNSNKQRTNMERSKETYIGWERVEQICIQLKTSTPTP